MALASVATIVALWTIALTGGDGGDDVTAPWDRHRLSSALVPERYNISLWPRLNRDPNSGLYIFTGKSTVEFECVKETQLILIHSNKLNYTVLNNTHTVRVTATGGGSAPGVQSTWLQMDTQYLVIQLDSELIPGQRYQLYTEFTGELADDLAGFYRSEYEEDGTRKIMAVSQMHPTHARKTFPCFDEPAMKSVFYITLTHPPGTVALSNGMETEIVNTTVEGVAVTQTTTHTDPYMGSPVGHRSGTRDYALNVTGPVLDFLQSYYNISYPLSKSDQIAIPDFYFGAMENWGLVTYRETNLLYDPLTSSIRNKETTVTIIAHELAHMWFGNLVTLRWWNEVWLNEGFASYVSYLGADHAEPAWNLKDLIILTTIVRPDQIGQQFDVISYSKGAAVLRMLSDFLSESIFVQGLSRYLNHFAYSNTVGNDLWQQLQLVVEANNVSLPGPVCDIMNRWVLQMGFPVVTIDTTTGAVSQKHFLLDPESKVTVESPYRYEWMIPVRWMKSGEVQRDRWWLMEKEAVNLEMKTGGLWILANVNVTGFYRVNYDLGNWERLLTQLDSEHQVIPVINRASWWTMLSTWPGASVHFQVSPNFHAWFHSAQLISTSLALRTTSYLLLETEYMPWQSALNNLQYYDLMLDRTDAYQPMQNYMRKLVTPLFLHFKNITSNWTRVPDGLTDQYNQVNAISMGCKTGLTECQSLTTAWFKQWMENPTDNPIHPNLRTTVYCSAVAAGDEAEWEFGWSQFKNATLASEASKLMSALACTKNKQLLQRYLSHTLNPAMIRKQDATSVITSVASNREGQSLAWDFVRDQWEYMFTQYGVGSFSFASMISGVTARFSTAAELQQLEEFVKQNSAAGFGSATLAVEQAVERTRANIKWLQLNQQEILDWFNSQSRHQTQRHCADTRLTCNKDE
ncbi:unnamed protein product [Pleuronectes platessa]|uniref:Aminopeptidase n=1 Tax=Pleuronectes platessa TaxID=8262 RepID=A0A9N7UP65_PLEPL|nr:unnamed protein product [Pleuronectes platessa]